MTLQTSGPISFDNLRTEFGVSGTLSFNSCYAGTQGEVPPALLGFNEDIPVSGSGTAISLSNFYQAQNIYQLTITSTAYRDTKLADLAGYDEDTSFGQLGANGSILPNLDTSLTMARTRELIPTNIEFSFGDGVSSTSYNAWTTVTFQGGADTIKLRRNQMVAVADAFTNFRRGYRATLVTGTDQPFEPAGSKVTILFENNGL